VRLTSSDESLGRTFLATGEYQISVVNRDPSLSEASYTLVASVDETPTLLRSGTPVFGLASRGQPAFFKFEQARQPCQPCHVRQPCHLSRATHHAPRTTRHAPRTTHHAQSTTHHAPRTTFANRLTRRSVASRCSC
jgi:hypothetical protein